MDTTKNILLGVLGAGAITLFTAGGDSTLPAQTQTASTFSAFSESLSECHPNYSGCLQADASDYDCKGGSGNGPYYTGKVEVYGADPFGLDRDGDGWGCE